MLNPFDADNIAAMAMNRSSRDSRWKPCRVSRAQSMDVLSSQANIAGYKAVLVANTYQRFMPMLMSWAIREHRQGGRVLIMGVGVAGLQAIATASAWAPSSRRPMCARPSRNKWSRWAPSSSTCLS